MAPARARRRPSRPTGPKADYNWKIKLPGEGHSSPVLWGDRLFITSAEPKDATQHVLCIDRRNGKILWKESFPSATHKKHLLNTFASSTPCVDEERVYIGWAVPEAITFVALTHEGKEVWRKNLGPFVNQHGFGTSPIIYKDLVILANDQGDPQGGRTRAKARASWRRSTARRGTKSGEFPENARSRLLDPLRLPGSQRQG